MAAEPAIPTSWAVYDPVDRCWMGSHAGPLTFEEPDSARIAALLLDARFGYSGRFEARPYDGKATVLRDELDPPPPPFAETVRILKGD